MKLRIGIGIGPRPAGDPLSFAELIDTAERLGIDSVWLPDVIGADIPGPLTGIAYAAGRTERLKLGTGITVLPGRNPVALAKELATLSALAPRRILPAFGLRHADPRERALFPLPGKPGEVMDEAFALLRRLLDEEDVTFSGRFFSCSGTTVAPRPSGRLDLWLGGAGPAALRRVGRLADGWLGAMMTPAETAAARRAIEAAAAEAGRAVDDDHYGLSLGVAFGDYPTRRLDLLRERFPEAAPGELVPVGWAAVRDLIRRHADGGVSKFVIRPMAAPDSWERFLEEFAAELIPLQT